ncbi:ATP-binding protein [Amycolatopsis sp. NPDC051758]|uniref:sensor histidine kinase n=1 Tax=Amycolatopsis sp. NPDC051758 TaxID=3363935 RepID=UPI0037A95713
MTRTSSSWPLRRSIAILASVEAVLLCIALVAGAVALTNLNDARTRLLDQTGPQLLQAGALATALVNQETGVRGYLLTRQQDFLDPYRAGLVDQEKAVAELRRLGAAPDIPAGRDLAEVLAAADTWRGVALAQAAPGAPVPSAAQIEQDKTLFDALRVRLAAQTTHLESARADGRADLSSAATLLTWVLVAVAVMIAAGLVLLYVGLQRAVVRPIRALATAVRDTASRDLHRPVAGTGPQEVRQLGEDVDGLRRRILAEVAELETAHALLSTRTQALERSNSDLEQFAYVASHDLQEPLRKVTSFCQLLQKRYADKLDERGDQYIGFAVDGAKRMQVLINDLLAFSRVGRRGGEPEVVESADLVARATANLEDALADTGARVTVAEGMPSVRGEMSLLTAVFQNLIGNAIKFRGEHPPEIAVSAERDGGDWVFSVTDNGIGIDARYADRIFVIFQRLHGRAEYPGTGIGLAMCRKIVEHHGGRIWLDTETTAGTRFRFTLLAHDVSEVPAEEQDAA